MKNDGGPAFPLTRHWMDDQENAGISKYPGLSLRDYFAAAALTGLFANSSDAFLLAIGKENPTGRMSETYAKEAYEAANAMLAERDKR